MAVRLDALPAVSTAFDRSEISWTQARVICGVASPADEHRWLALAREHTVEALTRIAKRTRPPRGIGTEPDPDANEIDGEPSIRWRLACPARVRALWRRARELASRMAGEPLADWQAAEIIAAEGFSGRPSGAVIADRVLVEAMRRARRRRRSRGKDALSDADAVQVPIDELRVPTDPPRAPGDALRVQPHTALGPTDAPPTLTAANPFALDARLVAAMEAIRKSEPDMGRLLRVVIDHHFYRSLGFASFDAYARERLGISTRKAWALAKLDRATSRSDDFARAYANGTLSWARALTLLPVLDRANAEAWVARADAVTVRRLADEVNAVLEARDALGPSANLDPLPLDTPLTTAVATVHAAAHVLVGAMQTVKQVIGEGVQIGAHVASLDGALAAPVGAVQIGAHVAETVPPQRLDTLTEAASRTTAGAFADTADMNRRALAEVCDVEIQLTAPVSVVAFLRDALDAFADPCAPRWTAFERLLWHVIAYWESTPRHRDPIFARDGWRCTVPACSSRRSLHDHHVVFRSRGGGNARENRTTICAAHHLHGVHAGTIRASGEAPSDIRWELGVRSGAPPLLTYVGDRRCFGDDLLSRHAAAARRAG